MSEDRSAELSGLVSAESKKLGRTLTREELVEIANRPRATFEVDRERSKSGELHGTVTIEGLPRVSDACAACALLEPDIAGVVPLDELLTAAVAAGMAIVMAGGGTAKHLCKRHQEGVATNLHDAIEAAEVPL